MQAKWQHLAWDSDFFGFPVARITLDDPRGEGLPEALGSLRENGYRLAYWLIPHERKAAEYALCHGGFLADQKVTFVKSLANSNRVPSAAARTVPYTAEEPCPQLLSIALQSGEYSRFRVDPGFTDAQFEELYRLWITRSVRKEIASEVLVVRAQDALWGMVTVGPKGGRGDIGLLAVAEEARGKGVGRILVEEADAFFQRQGFASAQVVTQRRNIGGCRLYEACGYQEEKVEDVYHFWLEDL